MTLYLEYEIQQIFFSKYYDLINNILMIHDPRDNENIDNVILMVTTSGLPCFDIICGSFLALFTNSVNFAFASFNGHVCISFLYLISHTSYMHQSYHNITKIGAVQKV